MERSVCPPCWVVGCRWKTQAFVFGAPGRPLFDDGSEDSPLVFKIRQAVHRSLQVMKEEAIEIEGRVHTVLPGTMFRVELDNKHLVLATICGKMRKRWVRLTVGDRVKMEMSPYDLNKARITWRLR